MQNYSAILDEESVKSTRKRSIEYDRVRRHNLHKGSIESIELGKGDLIKSKYGEFMPPINILN